MSEDMDGGAPGPLRWLAVLMMLGVLMSSGISLFGALRTNRAFREMERRRAFTCGEIDATCAILHQWLGEHDEPTAKGCDVAEVDCRADGYWFPSEAVR